MEISDIELVPCPICGGMTLLVNVPKGAAIWCSECNETLAEASYDGIQSKEMNDMVAAELARTWKAS